MKKTISNGAFAYPGGTGKTAKLLHHLFPPDGDWDTYVEPFVGGGSVFWSKDLSKKSAVLADLDKRITKIFRDIGTGKLEQELNRRGCILANQQSLDKFAKSNSSLDLIALWRMAFNSIYRSPKLRKNLDGKRVCFPKLKKNLPMMRNKLRSVKIETADYASTIAKHDSPSSFFFVDPPWEVPEVCRMYKHCKIDWTQMIDRLGSIAGRFMVYSRWNSHAAKHAKESGLRVIHVSRRRKSKRSTASTMPSEAKDGYMLILNYGKGQQK